MLEAKQYNPNIVWVKLKWSESELGRLERHIHTTMMHAGFSPNFLYKLTSSTQDNLMFGLVPIYSPLYKQWQIKLYKPGQGIDDWVQKWVINLVQKYLEEVALSGKNIDDITNEITLTSQFSGMMIRRILERQENEKEYMLWKLFRHAGKWKVKQYSQLEGTISDINISEVTWELTDIVSKIMWENFQHISTVEKSFPFVSPWFEFVFQNWEGRTITVVWGYLDKKLLSDFAIKEDYFLFGINTNKFISTNQKWPKSSNWRGIPLQMNNNFTQITRDISVDVEGKIVLQPSKIHLLVQARLDALLWNNATSMLEEENKQIDIDIQGDRFIILWKWKEYFYPQISKYLEHYFWWKILVIEEERLELKMPNTNLESLKDVLICGTEHTEIIASEQEIYEFLWEKVDLLLFSEVLEKRGYKISFDKQSWYTFLIPWYKKNVSNFRQILWEVMFFIYPYIQNSKLQYKNSNYWDEKKEFYKEITVGLPQFLLWNNFNEVPQELIRECTRSYSDVDSIFLREPLLLEWWKKLVSSLQEGTIEYIQKKCPKLPHRGFSLEHLNDGIHVCFFILEKESGDALNNIYNFLYTIWWILWKEYNLTIDNTLSSLSMGQSFTVNDEDGVVWYLWSISSDIKIRWKCYMAEITIKI